MRLCEHNVYLHAKCYSCAKVTYGGMTDRRMSLDVKLPSSRRNSRVLAAALTVGMSDLRVRGRLCSATAPRLS